MHHPPAAANGDSVKGNKGSKVAKGEPCSKGVILNRVKSICIKENCQLTGSRMPGTGVSSCIWRRPPVLWTHQCGVAEVGDGEGMVVWDQPYFTQSIFTLIYFYICGFHVRLRLVDTAKRNEKISNLETKYQSLETTQSPQVTFGAGCHQV